MVSVNFSALLDAFEFVSADALLDNSAYLCLNTGAFFYQSNLDQSDTQDLPPDLDDPDRYLAIPHKDDLDLGRDLALDFARCELSADYDSVAAFFRSPSAYSRFKNLLERRGLLEDWYAFEQQATESALALWCEDQGLELQSKVQPTA